MKKILLSGASILAIIATTNANAAGYTCEELIEYTSCNTGYYLNDGDCIPGNTCPAGNYLQGVCPDGYEYSDTWSVENGAIVWVNNITQAECENEGDYCTWYGAGCLITDADPFMVDDGFISATGYECTACAAGSYQPSAGQYECITCPAGAYCGTTGLSAVSGQCAKGTYSHGGAVSCAACPATGLTDKDGAVVVATTPTAGATTISSCVIDDTVYFRDTKGVYRYKQDCVLLGDITGTNAAECEWVAEITGEDWNMFNDACSFNTEGTTILAPATESECLDLGGDWDTYFEEGKCHCDGWVWYIKEGKLMCGTV